MGADGAAGETALPAEVTLADDDQVDLVEVDDAEERGAGVTVEDVEGDVVL